MQWSQRKSVRIAAGLVAGAVLCLAPTTQAAELIRLNNGFEVVCDHHEVVEGRVRVYLKPAVADYMELSAESVAGFETMPDPPERANETKIEPTPNAAAITGRNAKLAQADLHQLLSKASSEHNIDEALLASVVKAESGGNASAVSHAGARGLMQLMPSTAAQLGVTDSFAPEQNVRGGSAYLDWLLTRYHDNIALALAAYNAGPGAVDKYHGIPPYRETQLYVARVVHEFNRRVLAARAAMTMRPSLSSTQNPQD